MTDSNFLKNLEFENKYSQLISDIENYLSYKNYDLKNLKTEELIQWHDENNIRKIYASEKCPVEIKSIILEFIKVIF